MSTKPAAAEPKKETVTLIAEHTHAGAKCKEGDKLDVSAAEKDWLIRHKKVAGPTQPQPAAAAASKE